jgi:NADP-dependent 3-hydroxy acid dehydrogenase YdfG
MTRTLEKRIGVVTGASSGIGEAVARELVSRGCRVVINARRRERLEALAAELNKGGGERRVVSVAGDASTDETISAVLNAAASSFGAEADAVIVNAGRGLNGSVFTSDTSQWEEVVRTNLLGAARLMRESAHRMVAQLEKAAAGSWMKRPHDIVTLGSSVGRHISPFSSMYGSTKFALHSLTEALRREAGPKGIRVTVVEPAVVKSEFQAVAGYDATNFGAFMEKIGPVLEPTDVARAIAFVLEQPSNVHMYDVALRPTRQDYP